MCLSVACLSVACLNVACLNVDTPSRSDPNYLVTASARYAEVFVSFFSQHYVYQTEFHSFILETYIAPLQETQRRSQPSHGQIRRASERCKTWKGGPPERNAVDCVTRGGLERSNGPGEKSEAAPSDCYLFHRNFYNKGRKGHF